MWLSGAQGYKFAQSADLGCLARSARCNAPSRPRPPQPVRLCALADRLLGTQSEVHRPVRPNRLNELIEPQASSVRVDAERLVAFNCEWGASVLEHGHERVQLVKSDRITIREAAEENYVTCCKHG